MDQTFRYQDFAPMFKAELFDPDQWAEYLRSPEQNILFLHRNITKDLHFGQVHRAGTGTAWILARTVTFAVT